MNGTWTPVTWREFGGQVREVASGFMAAGIRPGDRVGLMSRTRFEWTMLDYPILAAGRRHRPDLPHLLAQAGGVDARRLGCGGCGGRDR